MAIANGIGGTPPLPRDLGILEPERPTGASASAPAPGPGGSFADALGKALSATDRLQVDADRQAAEVARGGGNLHETAIALEKADVALRVATKVRNKLVEAYQEVMRMQV